MTVQEIQTEILSVILESTETEVEVTPQTHIVNDLGLSSIETMMMISDLDNHFGISIPTGRLRNVRTVADLTEIIVDTLKN